MHPSDIAWKFTKSSGKGGQHRNKVETTVILTHKPTGITIRVDEGRKQSHNKKVALKRLESMLNNAEISSVSKSERNQRVRQKTSGKRGEKRRTYRVRDNMVVDHISGKKATYKDVSRGKVKKLH